MKWSICFLLLSASLYARATNDTSDTMEERLKALELRYQLARIANNKDSFEKMPTTLARSNTTPRAVKKPKPTTYASCKETPAKVSGVYQLHLNDDSTPFNVYCEQEKFGGGWIVVQHRFDGSVDFYRNWTDYRDGFGELDNEFWLGLEKIHQITSARKHQLLIEMKDFEGNYTFARYYEFHINNESLNYRLNILGSYTGTASDGLSHHLRKRFSTKDRMYNNAGASGPGADYYLGGWWYGITSTSNLNGPYRYDMDPKTIWWYHYKRQKGLSFTRMMVREY
ncbi:ficolin-1-like [Anopheles aquasalis]|uniref:ficolin-1-like n=1 Tax=Anopheles aquasalis TaxID=42839 RepID=UPI00215B4E73|nr:ficolin-1-like [Anopheles aquasalis]